MKVLMKALVVTGLLWLGVVSKAAAEIDLSTQQQVQNNNVTLTFTFAFYNRRTGVMSYEFTLTNEGDTPLTGPVHMVFSDHSPSASLLNETDKTVEGWPVLTIDEQVWDVGESIAGAMQWLDRSTSQPINEIRYYTQAAENVAPVITSEPVLSVNEDEIYLYQVLVVDPDPNEQLTYSLVQSPQLMEISTSGEISWLPSQQDVGIHDVHIQVADSADNRVNQSYQLTVVDINDKPTWDPIEPIDIAATESFSLALQAMDEDQDPLTYSLVSGPTGLVVDATGGLDWTPGLDQQGEHQVEVSASDGAESTNTVFTLRVGPPPVPAPEFIDADNLVGFVDIAFSHRIQVQAEQDVELELLSAPDGLSLDAATGQISWISQLSGDYTVEVKAKISEALYSTKTYQLKILSKPSTHAGDDFWLVFSSNIKQQGSVFRLYLSSKYDTQGSINAPHDNLTIPFSIVAGEVTVVDLPTYLYSPYAYNENILDNGIHVTSDRDITLYALNHWGSTTDGFLVLPTAALGQDYMTTNYGSDQFHIVATEDNTEVTITFVEDTTIALTLPVQAGEQRVINLQAGETYQVLKGGNSSGTALTGTEITSDKPVAVFSGARCSFVPFTVAACDHLVEQLLPIKYWGQEYYTIPLKNRPDGDLFQVVAAFDNTRVEFNGETWTVLNRGEWMNRKLRDPSIISANHPIQVVQMSQGTNADNRYPEKISPNYGDPFMILLTSVSQDISEYIFSTTDLTIEDNFVNVSIDASALSTLRLDGQPVDVSEFSAIQGSNRMAAQLALEEGIHTLTAETNFTASIYGFGLYYDSYGYQGGVSLPRYLPSTQINVPAGPHTAILGEQYCLALEIVNGDFPVQKARLDVTSNKAVAPLYHLYTNEIGQTDFCYYGLSEGIDSVEIRSGSVTEQVSVQWLPKTGDGSNTPLVVSQPADNVASNTAFDYQIIALDPDPLQALQVSLLDAPAGMTLDGNRLRWQPSDANIGSHQVRLEVRDDTGQVQEQHFELRVFKGNSAPYSYTNIEDKLVYLGFPVVYPLSLTDDDEDMFFCEIIDSPFYDDKNKEVRIGSSSCNSLLQVNSLSEDEVGIHPVKFRLWDVAGAETQYSFNLEIKKNNSPVVEADPDQFAKVDEPYVTQLQVSDPDGDELTFRIQSVRTEEGSYATLPLSIDEADGRLEMTATSAHVGKYEITLSVRDAISTLTYTYPLTISLPDEPLSASLLIEPKFINQNETVRLQAIASGGVGSVQFEMTVNGQPVSLDGDFAHLYTQTENSGYYQVELTATDDLGSFYQLTDYFAVRIDEGDGDGGGDGGTGGGDGGSGGGGGDGGTGGGGGSGQTDAVYPEVEILSLSDAQNLSEITPVSVRVFDENLAEWRVSLINDGNEQLLIKGNSNFEGEVTQLDPTLLRNGVYQLQLYAVDLNGQAAITRNSLLVDGNLKLGNFTYTVEEFTVPMVGLPITVSRTYDSRDKHIRGDFGYGWHLDYNLINLDKSRALGAAWSLNEGQRSIGPVPIPVYCVQSDGDILVNVTLPNDEVETFRAKASPECTDLVPTLEVQLEFEAVGDTTSTLELAGANNVRFVQDQLKILGQEHPFDQDDFILKTRQGHEYRIGANNAVSSIKGPNGNTLTFDDDGITHSAGRSVAFSRNADGMITHIRRPAANPNTVYSHRFSYDGADRLLERAGDAVKETYGYDYLNQLTSVKDALDRRKLFNVYDDNGRLVAQEDNEGNRTSYGHDLDGKESTVTDRNGNVTFYYYDARGNVTSMVDALGQVTAYTYDENDNELSVTDPLGNVTSRTFSDKSDLLSETDPEGNTTHYTYDARGNELTITDANGNVFTNTYDSAGNLLTVTDPDGNVAGNNINAQGLVEQSQDAMGNHASYTYDDQGNRLTQTDESGVTTTFTYDASNQLYSQSTERTSNDGTQVTEEIVHTYDNRGRLTRTRDRVGTIESMSYDALGNMSSYTDGYMSNSYEYDVFGRVTRTTFRNATYESKTYDAEGNMLSETDRNGHTTAYEYDALNRLVKTTYADGTFRTTEYDAASRIIAETDENGNKTSYGYDKAGRRTSVTDALGNISRFEYDGVGNLVKEIDAKGQETRYEYDSQNRRTKIVYADGTSIAETYDALGRKISQVDQNGRETQFAYDAMGRLTKVTDALGNETRYAFDEVGNKLTETDAEGRQTSWEYNDRGLATKRTLPMGQVERYAYNAADLLTSHTSFNGISTVYTYNGAEPWVVRTAFAYAENFEYDAVGNRIKATNFSGQANHYEYDERNRLTKETQANGTILEYGYDNGGNKTSLTVTYKNNDSRIETYEYDALNRLVSATDNDNQTTRFAYDDVGNQTHIYYPNGLISEYEYDSVNRVTAIQIIDAADTVISRYAYTLDATGRRTELRELSGRVTSFTYDELYRLVEERVADATRGDRLSLFQYDKSGNRVESTEDGVKTEYVYDDNDRLTQRGSTVYTYDAQGNMLTESDGVTTKTFGYDRKQQLESLDNGISTFLYRYNTEGVRIRVFENNVASEFIVDSNQPYPQVIAQQESDDSVSTEYLYAGDLLSQQSANAVHYYHYDSLGTTRALSDSSGAITDTYLYEAFGNLLDKTGDTENRYLFAGEQYDENLQQYYLRARYYDPLQGRFSQMDEWLGDDFAPLTLGKYLYANGDPVNGIDPSGLATLMQINQSLRIMGENAVRASGSVGRSMLDNFLFGGTSAVRAGAAGQSSNSLGFIGNLIMQEMRQAVIDAMIDYAFAGVDLFDDKTRFGTRAHTHLEDRTKALNKRLRSKFKIMRKYGITVTAEAFFNKTTGKKAARREKGSFGIDVVIRRKGKVVKAFDLKTGRGWSKKEAGRRSGKLNSNLFQIYIVPK